MDQSKIMDTFDMYQQPGLPQPPARTRSEAANELPDPADEYAEIQNREIEELRRRKADIERTRDWSQTPARKQTEYTSAAAEKNRERRGGKEDGKWREDKK